jgi:predicted transcriptional regulator
MSDKQLVLETLQQLPESVSLEQIQEEIALLAAIRRGQAAAQAQRLVEHDKVRERSATWITPSSGPSQP